MKAELEKFRSHRAFEGQVDYFRHFSESCQAPMKFTVYRPRAMDAADFLDRLYRFKGAKRYFDAVAIHPYSPDVSGIEFQLKKVGQIAATSGLAALLETSTMMGLGYLAGYLLGFTALESVFGGTQVWLAGGDPYSALTPDAAVKDAAGAALVRLYPQFDVGDHDRWDAVYDRARKGDGAALEAVGYRGDADKHPVCVAILKELGVELEAT